jgi:alkylation response protein AidB-like acyl-CoA dehydrogenase
MDLDLTSDQELFRVTTSRFIESTFPMTTVRAVSDADGAVDAEYLAQAGELGWFAMLVPDALGGGSISGDGVRDAAIVAEERGKLLQPGPFVAMNVVAHAIAAHGSDDLRAKVLPALVAGEQVATWAVADVVGAFRPEAGVDTTWSGSSARLSGTKGMVQDAARADWMLVTAADDGAVTQFLVGTDAPGVRIAPRAGFDLTRQMCEVTFDDVEVPCAQVLGSRGEATAAIERQLDLAAVLTTAESVGAMDRIFTTTVDYAKVRTAFGRPIGSFQAVKHLLADTALLLEESKAVVVGATHAVQREHANSSEAASMAKAFVGEAGVDLAQNCWQTFGGIAYTWEHDFHLYLRRLALDAVLYGDATWHRERICRLHGLGAS